MKSSRVAVLRGGPSNEYEVSIKTGTGVLSALERLGIQAKDIVITKDGRWISDGFVTTQATALAGVDMAFIALHGEYGEDGQIQRVLERYNIPYTGSTPLASALAMNKVLTKEQVQSLGVSVAKHMLIRKEGNPDPIDTAHVIAELFGPEYVIKPLRGGSSVDTRMINNVGQLAQAITDLLKKYDEVLVEERIRGREFTVGVLENFRDTDLYVLPSVEICPPQTSEFFDYENKYNGLTEEICPGRLNSSERAVLENIALAVHKQMGLRHYSRSDFILTLGGPVFLEVNTLPGLTAESLFPKSMEAIGADYDYLIEHLVSLALKK